MSLLDFEDLQGQSSQHLPGSWVPLSQGQIPSQCAAGSPVASCPCRVSTLSTSSYRESKAALQLSPVLPVASPRALQLLCLSLGSPAPLPLPGLSASLPLPCTEDLSRMPWCALKHWCYANTNRRIICTLTPSAVSLQTSVKHAEL